MGVKHQYEDVVNILKDCGYTLLSTEYLGNHKKIEVLCNNQHIWVSTLADIYSNGQRCPECQGIKRYGIEEVTDIFRKSGYAIYLVEYENARKKIVTTCPNGHLWAVPLFKFIKGVRCPQCSGSIKYTIDQVRKCVEEKGYTLLSETYSGSNSPLSLRCPKSHDVSISFSCFRKRPYPCKKCKPLSGCELELFNIIQNIHTNAHTLRDRKVAISGKPYIKGFDIDIYVPELKKGIEFDGKYHHSFERMRKSGNKRHWSDEDIKNYHQIKDDYFASKGIQILHIKEQDWIKDKELCIERCLEFLGDKL